MPANHTHTTNLTDPSLLLDPRSNTTPAQLPSKLPPDPDWRKYALALDGHCDFIYAWANDGNNRQLKMYKLASGTILLYAPTPALDCYLVVTADGHVHNLQPPQLTSRFQELNKLRQSFALPPLPQPTLPTSPSAP